MIFVVIKLFFLFNIFQLTVTTSGENGLLKYKTGIDKIGMDVENFIYEIAKEVAKKADSFINNEYQEYDASTEENPILENSIRKEEATTSATVNVIEDYTEQEEERRKRSIDDIHREDNIIATAEKPEVPQESNVIDHSVDDIKQELKKLTDLTVMLKEQQNILALLGEKGKFLNNNLQYDPQDMIHVLEQLEEQRKILKPTKENNKELKHLKIDIQEAIGALNKTSEGTDNEKDDKELKLEYEIKQQKEEIEMLKDLVEQILEKQDKLKNKYKKDKKKDKKVITSNNSTSSEEDKSSEEKRESEDDILGVSLFLQPLVNKPPPRERESNMKDLKKENVENKDKEQFFNQKNPPDGKKDQEKTKKETTDVDNKATNEQSNAKSIRYDDPKVSLVKSNERSTHYEEPNLPSRKSEARASSLESDISQFLDEIDGNKKPDMEEQLKELEEKFIKQTREEKIKRELARLRKLIGKNNEDEKAGSKSLPQNEDVEFLKRLETLMKSRGRDIKVEEKPTDSIREELKKLQIAIDKLKPKEDVSPEVKEHPKIGPEAKELPDEVKIDQEAVLQLSTHQLRQLRNKIDEILRIQEGSAKHSIIPEISSKAPLKQIIDTKKAGPYPSWYKGSTSEPCSPYDYPYRPFNSPQHSPFSPPHGLKHIGDNEILPNFSNGGPSSFLDRSLMEKDIRSPYFQNDRSVAEFNYGLEGTERYIPQQPDYYPMPINYNDMDIPPYNGMYYEQSGINRLEQEIQELKAIISSGNKDKTPKPSFSPEIQSHPKRYKRSLDESGPPRQERSSEVSSSSSDMQLFDDVTSKLREYFLEENSKGRTAADTRETGFNEITDRLNKLKSQLEEAIHRTNEKVEYFPLKKYQEPSYQYPTLPKIIYKPIFPEIKKDDILSNIIVKIIEKGLAILPQILGKLFGMGAYTLFESVHDKYDDPYGTSYDSNYNKGYSYDHKKGYGNNYNQGYGVSYNTDNDLMAIFHKLGVFGYIPLICLNIIKVITVACKLIRKNKIFTNFIVPTIVLLLVAGSIIFLTWWLQPDKDLFEEKLIGFDNSRSRTVNPNSQYNYNYYGSPRSSTSGYYNNYNQHIPYPLAYYRNPYNYYSYGGTDRRAISQSRSLPMVYFRSYFEDGSRKV